MSTDYLLIISLAHNALHHPNRQDDCLDVKTDKQKLFPNSGYRKKNPN